MIILTGRNTCRATYVPENYIDHIEELVDKSQERDYPYSRIYIKNVKDDQEYYIDVVESKRKINQIIAEHKKQEGMKPNERKK